MSIETNPESPSANQSQTPAEAHPDTHKGHQLIGDFLRELREKQKISLAEISEKTRIHLTLLRDLENNNMNALPDKTYVRGFIKAYAKVIGIDSKEALAHLDSSYEQFIPKAQNERPENTAEDSYLAIKQRLSKLTRLNRLEEFQREEAASSLRPGLIKVGILLLLIPLLGFPIHHFYKIYYSAQSVDEANKAAPAESTTTSTTTTSTTTVDSPKSTTAPSATDVLGTSGTFQNPGATTAPPIAIVEGLTKTLPEAQDNNKTALLTEMNGQTPLTPPGEAAPEEKGPSLQKITTPLFTVNPQAPEANDPEILPPDFKSSLRSGEENVFIKATDGDSWITYKKDQSAVRTYVLKKGQHLFLHGKEIRVLLGNINATKVFYNNQLIQAPTSSGVKNLIFPPAANSKFQLPLFIHKDGKTYTSDEVGMKNP